MRVDLTIDRAGKHPFDVALSGSSGMRLGEVLPRLRAMAGLDERAPAWIAGNPICAASVVGQPPLLPGAVLRLGARDRPAAARSSMLELRVIGGPDVGSAIDLPVGSRTLGRAPDCDLVLTDPDVSRYHARVTTNHDIVLLEALRPTNECSIDGVPVGDRSTPLRVGQVMRLGDSLLALAGPEDPPAHGDVRDGRIVVTRRGRRHAPHAAETFELPDGQQPPRRFDGVVTPTAIALASGIVVALVMRNLPLLIMSVAMPVAALGTSAAEYVRRRRSTRRRAIEHQRDMGRIEAQIQVALRAEAARLRDSLPDVATLLRIASARTRRLWERLPTDPDHLLVRVGTGERMSQVTVTRGDRSLPRTMTSVPIAADLSAGPVSVTGPPGPVVKIAGHLVCQLSAFCSPTDLEIIGVFAPRSAPRWAWLRWLPHVRRTPATTPAAQEALAAHLADVVSRRQARASDGRQHPWLVVLIDVADGDLHPGIARALAVPQGVRVTALAVGGASGVVTYATAVEVHGETGTRVRVSTPEGTLDAVADLMPTRMAHALARALAPLVDATEVGQHREAAGSTDAGLLGLLQLSTDPSAADIAGRWALSDRMLRAIIGISDGAAAHVDLARDGPHALIAGTTGSGKSECLQTLIVSLAATYPPDQVAFVLIDYKGGAAFAVCSRLPHVAGLVTDLDPSATHRALSTLDGELRRRESLLARHTVPTFADLQELAAAPALPRLIIVVDEFAALAEDAPDLLRGLVGVAQRGRSLGVHLILATQRPAGVVSADIRANASLRIALRMTDPSESLDVIGTDRAADIDPSSPGKAIVSRAGVFATTQIARVSGRTVHAPATPAVVRLHPWRDLPIRVSPADDPRIDDLTVLVDAIAAAACEGAYSQAEPPWLAPLPAMLDAASLPAPARRDLVPIGVIDMPADRTRLPATIDLARGGTIVIAGSARTGKTAAAKAIATRAALQLASDELRVTTIGGELAPLDRLTDRSTALDVADFAATAAALHRLKAELFAGGQTAPTYRLFILDGWDQFASASDEADLGRSVDTVLQICRRAHSARCTVVITGDRSVLTPRITSVSHRMFLLGLTDRADYGLVGIARSAVPDRMPPGRALLAPDGHQVQFALPPSHTGQPICG